MPSAHQGIGKESPKIALDVRYRPKPQQTNLLILKCPALDIEFARVSQTKMHGKNEANKSVE